jgi:antitoxin component of RelBE/YafQ-DinJ toxin-antitoxin module
MAVSKLQIPIKADLKSRAEQLAKRQGFSSLQEVVRVFLTGYVSGQINPTFMDEKISSEMEQKLWLIKEKMEQHTASDNEYTAKTGEDLLKLIKEM